MPTIVHDMPVPSKGQKCNAPDCTAEGTVITEGPTGIAVYCEQHSDHIMGRRNPEYVANCPNCGCVFGVN